MVKLFIIHIKIALLLFICAVPLANAQTQQSSLTNPQIEAFTYGEKLVYKVRYNLYFNLNVGKVTFEVNDKPVNINGMPTMHVKARGRTFGFYDPFFRVRDRYETYISPRQKMKPLSFLRIVREGGYSKDIQLTFDHARQQVQKVNLEKQKVKHFNIPSQTYDILSMLYAARCFDYGRAKVGDEFYNNVFIGDTTYSVRTVFKGRDKVKTNAGKFRCIKLSPQPIAGDVFDEESHMVVWVTDDANRVPVRVESDISVGAIRADLDDYQGLKYRMDARLD